MQLKNFRPVLPGLVAVLLQSCESMNVQHIEPLRTRLLGSSQLKVTEACLGTMTFGLQNTEAEAHAQLDFAVKERGVNFIDTAEMYPTPNSAPGWEPGRSEEIVGTWLAANRQLRHQLVIATKVIGYSRESPVAANREVNPNNSALPDARLDRTSVLVACDASLRRLQARPVLLTTQ